MATQTINDQALIELIFEIIREHGYEGTSITQLSEATGLKKSSLYYRFPNGKEDILKAVVTYVSTTLNQSVLQVLQNSQLPPLNRFRNMTSTLKVIYGHGSKNCLLNVLNFGNVNPVIKSMLKEIYVNFVSALTKLATDSGMDNQQAAEWAENFIITLEGVLVVQKLTENHQLFENWISDQQARLTVR